MKSIQEEREALFKLEFYWKPAQLNREITYIFNLNNMINNYNNYQRNNSISDGSISTIKDEPPINEHDMM